MPDIPIPEDAIESDEGWFMLVEWAHAQAESEGDH